MTAGPDILWPGVLLRKAAARVEGMGDQYGLFLALPAAQEPGEGTERQGRWAGRGNQGQGSHWPKLQRLTRSGFEPDATEVQRNALRILRDIALSKAANKTASLQAGFMIVVEASCPMKCLDL